MEIDSRPLQGRFVRLEPFAPELEEPVRAALATDEEAWSIMVTNGGPGGFAGWWAGLTRPERPPVFAVRRLADGAVVGASGYHDARPEHRGVAVGHTFYRPDARSGPVNPECKLLLLDHAFAAGAIRVEFHTDAVNAPSRAALRKLGAAEEGVLRRHKITWTGRVRDTVMFSITDEDWPQVRKSLKARLETFASAGG